MAFAQRDVGLHLAIFAEPYLTRALTGQKTIESRFSQNRCAPFDMVRSGDIIMLKAPGGPVRGLALVKQAQFFDLTNQTLAWVRETFGAEIGAGEEFWDSRRDAAFATIIEIAEAIEIEPMEIVKRDRRGWVPLWGRQMVFEF